MNESRHLITVSHIFFRGLVTKDRHLKYALLPSMFTDMELSTFQGASQQQSSHGYNSLVLLH